MRKNLPSSQDSDNTPPIKHSVGFSLKILGGLSWTLFKTDGAQQMS